MKKYFLLLTVSLLFASCKSYIQIYDVDSTSAKTSNEQFVFENEDCKLTAYVKVEYNGERNFFCSLPFSDFINSF